jgi:hypothetical protein
MRLLLLTRRPRGHTARRLMQAAALLGIRLAARDPRQVTLPLLGPRPDGVWLRPGGPATAHGLAVVQALVTRGCVALHGTHALEALHPPWRLMQTLVHAGVAVPAWRSFGDVPTLLAACRAVGRGPWQLTTQGVGGALTTVTATNAASARAAAQVLLPWGGHGMVSRADGEQVRVLTAFGAVLGAVRRQRGTWTAVDVSRSQQALAVRAGEALGLVVAGVDLARDARVAAVTAAPALQAVEVLTGTDVALVVMDGWATFTRQHKQG